MTAATTVDVANYRLPAKLNSAAAAEVLAAIKSHKGRALSLDAGDVSMIGAQCVQVLVAAQRQWSTDEKTFEVRNLSGEMRSSLGILGLSPEEIGAREAAYGA